MQANEINLMEAIINYASTAKYGTGSRQETINKAVFRLNQANQTEEKCYCSSDLERKADYFDPEIGSRNIALTGIGYPCAKDDKQISKRYHRQRPDNISAFFALHIIYFVVGKSPVLADRYLSQSCCISLGMLYNLPSDSSKKKVPYVLISIFRCLWSIIQEVT